MQKSARSFFELKRIKDNSVKMRWYVLRSTWSWVHVSLVRLGGPLRLGADIFQINILSSRCWHMAANI